MEKVFSSELLYRAIDRRRRGKRLSWNETAKAIGVSRWRLHRIVNDGAKPWPDGMKKILAWLGLKDDSLFYICPEVQYAVENDFYHLENPR